MSNVLFLRDQVILMHKKLAVFFATLVIVMCTTAGATSASPAAPSPLQAISGLWYTEGHEGGVQLYPCDDKICGRLYWMQNKKGADDEKGVSRDVHNPDPSQRQRPLCQMQFMGNFTPGDNNLYASGWVYNPRDGGIYSAEMTLVDSNTLKLRGYLFLPILGESQIWTRAKSMPDCATND